MAIVAPEPAVHLEDDCPRTVEVSLQLSDTEIANSGGFPTVQAVETILAVIKYIYTGDNVIRIPRYIHGVREAQASLSILEYDVEGRMSPFDIAGSRRVVSAAQTLAEVLEEGSSVSSFASIAQRMTLVIRGSDEDGENNAQLGRSMITDPYQSGPQQILFCCTARQTCPVITLHYHPDKKTYTAISHIIDTVQTVSRSAALSWTSAIDELNFLGPLNWKTITEAMKTPPKTVEHCLNHILIHQASERSISLAVDAWDGTFTYAELYRQSANLAAGLLSQGIQPQERIGLCMNKSKWTLVAVCAILLTGATCVPIDIRAPQQRIELLIKTVQARLVLTDEANSIKFDIEELEVLLCDTERMDPVETTTQLPRVDPSSVAFIYFTSGSTGIPKGVVQEHGAFYTTVQEFVEAFSLSESSRTFQYASYVFDPSMGDVFGTFLAGGCVCIPSEEQRLSDPSAAINDFRATHACLTNMVLAQLSPAAVPTLQQLFVGGEALDRAQFLRWKDHVCFHLIYGTTESIIWDSLASSTELVEDASNLGRTTTGSYLWVVNPGCPDRLAPVGAMGEILIEGANLARGYLDNTVTTNAKFISAPAWLRSLRPNFSTRAYRSGDMGFANLNGSVTFRGRADTQIKIRGQRIELEEIESTIKLLYEVWNHVIVEAVTIPSRGDSKVLAAFFAVTTAGEEEQLALPMTSKHRTRCLQVQYSLSNRLPVYMIPSIFVPIGEVPRTVSGKIDRNTLKNWMTSMSADAVSQYYLISHTSRKPSNENEEWLARAWAAVLQIPETSIGAEDDFFMLGGDSIKVIQLSATVRDAGKSLKSREMFNNARLCDMAAALSEPEGHNADVKPFSLLDNDVELDFCLKEVAKACGVAVDSIADIYPTSSIQEALMAISTRRPHMYRQQAVLKLPNTVDLLRFKSAIETLVSVQTIFRTRIVVIPGVGSVQAILRSGGTIWTAASSLEQYLAKDRDTVLGYGCPLFRFAIAEAEDGNFFVWTCHHSVYDAWSRNLMYDEIFAIYTHGVASPDVPYNRFIQHVTEPISLLEAEDFWRGQFLDVIEKFPTYTSDHVPEPLQMQSFDFSIPHGSKSNITMATIIQGAWAIVNARHAGGNDALFGMPLSGRDTPVPGIVNMMAPTIGTVPMRITIDNTMTIAEYLRYVQDQVLRTKTYQHLGLQNIRRLSPEAGSAVDFTNLLVIHPSEEEGSGSLSKLGLDTVSLQETDSVDLALTLQCIIKSDDIVSIKAHYDAKIIHPKKLHWLLHQLGHVSSQLATESLDRSVHDLDLVSLEDRKQYAQWHSVEPRSVSSSLHELFRDKALSNPASMAISGFDGEYSYKWVDSVSDKLAFHLISLGVGIESKVMLAFAKSSWPIIAMLAILKSGGVCCSVNPDHPNSRIVEIGKDTKAKVLLCDEHNAARFIDSFEHVVVVNASSLDGLTPGRRHDLPKVLPSNAAFIVYTSGSTGKPKGSILEHQNLSTSLMAIGEKSYMGPNSRVLQFSAYTFDAHILEIIGTFIHGGCVCVISDNERMNNLESVIDQRKVNWSLLTPTVARLLSPENIPSLQTLILSGEPLAQRDVHRWASRLRLLNGLGPSECSILACITDKMTTESLASNIGFPLGCHVWITDRRRFDRLAPLGCVGELVLEGPILGRGYINRPKATAAAFLKDPAWSRDGSEQPRRFYRTGDLAQLNHDGSITFHGRADGQVKIRGQRVELSEIEHKIKLAGSIVEQVAVEVVKLASRGDMQFLAAFISCNQTEEVRVGELPLLEMHDDLRAHFTTLQRTLSDLVPRYMIPSLFLPVRKLPISPNGKLERKVLRDWVSMHEPQHMEQYFLRKESAARSPSTQEQMKLQCMWSQVLKLPAQSIGLDDNFFALGGDSVTAMELIAAARNGNVALSVANVFKYPRLEDMAQTMKTLAVAPVEPAPNMKPFALVEHGVDVNDYTKEISKSCQIPENSIEDVYPATAIQEALLAVSSYRPWAYTHQAVFEISASVDIDRFKNAWATLYAAQPILRTRIFTHDTKTIQVVLRSSIQWQTNLPLEQYLKRDQADPMMFGTELSRWAIVSGDNSFYFVWTAHHSIYDGWSLNRTFREVAQLYHTGSPSRTSPFRDFVQYLGQLSSRDSEDFWRQQLVGSVEGYPVLPSHDYKPIPRCMKAANMRLAPNVRRTVTTASVIQAAWALLMTKYTGDEKALFGMTLSGRDVPVTGITDVIGPTLTTVPVRVPIEKSLQVVEFLSKVQEQILQVRHHQHTGLQHIRRLSKYASAAVEFQNLLVIQHVGDQELASHLDQLGLLQVQHEEKEFFNLALTLECIVRPDSIQFNLRFDENVVVDAQAELILTQLQHVLSNLMDEKNQEIRLLDIDVVSSEEMHFMRSQNGNLAIDTPQTIHEIIELQTRIDSGAIAIEDAQGSVTYAELDAMSNNLVTRMTELGFKREEPILTYLKKSALAIVAQLAVLKFGGWCVPVPHGETTATVLEIREMTGSTVVLCDSEQGTRLSGLFRCVLPVDSTSCSVIQHKQSLSNDASPQPVAIRPSDLAYVISTDGTTAKPKACVWDHGALSSGLKKFAEGSMYGSKTRTLQSAPYGSIASTYEIFGTLFCGGCVCVIKEEQCQDLQSLAAAANAYSVNWSYMTPTMATTIRPMDIPSLSTLVIGGERITLQCADVWRASSTRTISSYGSAETGLILCETSSDRLTHLKATSMTSLWVTEVDDPDKLIPIGGTGEMLIESSCVMRGHLESKQLIDTCFIVNPSWGSFTHLPETLVYRSGDLVRRNADGSVCFVDQIAPRTKTRVQQCKLGRIEDILHKILPPESQVFVEVVADHEKSYENVVAAFIRLPTPVIHDQSSDSFFNTGGVSALRATISALEQQLHDKLPYDIVPSVFIPLAKVPTTSHGKLNRRHLREQFHNLTANTVYRYGTALQRRTPSNDMESSLHSIWCAILGHTDISVDDNFTSLGGDSIIAMQIITACRKANIDLTVSTLLNKRSISSIAPFCTRSSTSNTIHTSHSKLRNSGLNDVFRQELLKIGVQPSSVESIFPCTTIQEGILLSQQRDRGSYRVTCIWEVNESPYTKKTNAHDLERAWQYLVTRHSTMRTGIYEDAMENGCFNQVLLKEPPPRISHLDGVLAELEDLASLEVPIEHPFWSHLPRLTIVHLQGGKIACRVDICHTMIDGSSLDLLMGEFVDLLSDKISTSPSTNYEDFVNYEQSLSKTESLVFWTRHLDGIAPCYLPNGPPSNDLVVDYGVFELSGKATSRIIPFCKSLSITPAAFVQTAWSVLLSMFTNNKDVCFGYLANGRDAPVDGIESSIGLFISMQVCRVQTSGSVEEMMNRVQNNIIEALNHRHCSLASIQNRLGFRDTPLFNTCVTVRRDVSEEKAAKVAKTLRTFDLPDKSEYAVALNATVSGSKVSVAFSYQCEQISQEQAENIGYSLETIMQSLAKDPKKSINDIELLGPRDHLLIQQLTAKLPVVDSTIHELVERQVSVTPNAIAVTGTDGQLTYQELDTLADKLADYLLRSKHDIGPEFPIMLGFKKSKWAIVSMLAVLKTGSYCVPVNPEHPTNRLKDLRQDVGSDVVLCDPDNASRFVQLASVIAIDSSFFARLPSSTTDLETDIQSREMKSRNSQVKQRATSQNAAFVVFTSGSTGKPKGNVLEHRSLSTALTVHSEKMLITETSRVLQFAAYTFDGSIFEIFAPLIRGGCVCQLSDDERMNHLAEAVRSNSANWTFQTPSVLQLLSPSDIPTIKTIVVGGEKVSKQVVEQWCEDVNLFEAWGPSECSIFSSYDILDGYGETSNIGRAVGCHLWVVEQGRSDRLLPIGCVGELLVEGPGLGRGYINNEKANQAFITDPLWSHGGQSRRFYRSGDLARLNSDGTFTFMGRSDSQVKIHGQRAELSEIEHHLRKLLPPMTEVVVDMITLDQSSEQSLAALINFESAEISNSKVIDNLDRDEDINLVSSARERLRTLVPDLARYLGEILPQYMIPSIYIPISSVHKTESKKTDRRRLKLYAQSLPREAMCVLGMDTDKAQPSNETELALQSAWSRVLNIPQHDIGIDDAFTSLGGDSITAIRAIIECRKASLKVSVTDVFKERTIRAIAVTCAMRATELNESLTSDGQAVSANGSALSSTVSELQVRERLTDILQRETIDESNIQEILPLAAFQKISLDGNMHKAPKHWNYLLIDCPGGVDVPRLRTACQQLIDHFDILRTIFVQTSTGEALQVTLKALALDFSEHNSAEDIGLLTDTLCRSDLFTPKKWAIPFVRFMVASTSSAKRLIVRLSHAQFDGYSCSKIVDALAAFYTDRPVSPSIRYSEFIHHIQKNNQQSHSYWRLLIGDGQLTKIPQITRRQHLKPDPSGVRVNQDVPHITPHSGATAATIFTAACATLLASLTGELDVLFGRLTSGRAGLNQHITEVVGPCLNIVPVRVHVEAGRNVTRMLDSIQTQAVESSVHDTVSFNELIKHCATNWPKESSNYFPMVVQYLNVDATPQAGDFRLSAWDNTVVHPFPESLCVAGFPNENGLVVSVSAGAEFCDHDIIERMNIELCKILVALNEQVDVLGGAGSS